jgi:hypothetical protein
MEGKESHKAGTPRPSSRKWVWIILGLVGLILVLSYVNRTDDLIEIPSGRFADMVLRRDIGKLVFVNNEEVIEITLTQDALQKTFYKQELQRSSPFGIKPEGPHYKMKIASIDHFLDTYEEIAADIPREQQVDLQIEERSDSTGMIINWTVLLLLLLGLGSLVRWMSGLVFNLPIFKSSPFATKEKITDRLPDKETVNINLAQSNSRKFTVLLLTIIALVTSILVVRYFRGSGDPVEIQSSQFADMIVRRDIETLVLVQNLEQLEITLKPDAFQDSIYQQELGGISPDGPHYLMRTGSVHDFLDSYKEIIEDIPSDQQIDLRVEERSDIKGMLINWGFLFLIFFVFAVVIRGAFNLIKFSQGSTGSK